MNREYLILLFVSLMSSGCATITTPAINTYAINISCEVDRSSEKKTRVPKVLTVSIPGSTAAIMNKHIIYHEAEFGQNPYAHSMWSDTPNKMLGSLFHSCVNQGAIFNAVLPAYSKGKGDFLLESTILDFYHHINADKNSEGRVRVVFYLIETKNGNVVATKEFSSRIGSETLDAKGGVRALNAASKAIVLSLTQWLLSLNYSVIH